MQNFCVGRESCSIFKYNNSKLIENVNKIISEYDKEDVYYIVNIMEDNEANKEAPFKAFEGSYDAEIVSNLLKVNDKVFRKYESNAFLNESLVQALKDSQVDEIEVTTDLYKHWGFTEYTFKRIVVFNRRIRKTFITIQ